MRISDWSSDVCSSDLLRHWAHRNKPPPPARQKPPATQRQTTPPRPQGSGSAADASLSSPRFSVPASSQRPGVPPGAWRARTTGTGLPCPHGRSEEHTSELQSLMRISYAVLRLKKKTINNSQYTT